VAGDKTEHVYGLLQMHRHAAGVWCRTYVEGVDMWLGVARDAVLVASQTRRVSKVVDIDRGGRMGGLLKNCESPRSPERISVIGPREFDTSGIVSSVLGVQPCSFEIVTCSLACQVETTVARAT
jgi:hypothetical protein